MNKPCSCAVALSLCALCITAQTTTPTPVTTHAQRAAEVDRRGDQGMGFSHDTTGHHFHLFSDGGAIEVESNSAADDTSKAAIRRSPSAATESAQAYPSQALNKRPAKAIHDN